MAIRKELLRKKIDCPKCFVPMVRKNVEIRGPNIDIDVCPECKGIWLDDRELHKILHDRKMADYLTKDIGTESKSKLVCPRCGGLMDIEKAGDIEVDVCIECNGVWLDSGELSSLRDEKDSFKTDAIKKSAEKWEDSEYARQLSLLDRFMDWISR